MSNTNLNFGKDEPTFKSASKDLTAPAAFLVCIADVGTTVAGPSWSVKHECHGKQTTTAAMTILSQAAHDCQTVTLACFIKPSQPHFSQVLPDSLRFRCSGVDCPSKIVPNSTYYDTTTLNLSSAISFRFCGQPMLRTARV